MQMQRIGLVAQVKQHDAWLSAAGSQVTNLNKHLHEARARLQAELDALDGQMRIARMEAELVAQLHEQQRDAPRPRLAPMGDRAAQLGAEMQMLADMIRDLIAARDDLVREVEMEAAAPEVAREAIRLAFHEAMGRSVIRALRPLGFGPQPMDRDGVKPAPVAMRNAVMSQREKPLPEGLFDATEDRRGLMLPPPDRPTLLDLDALPAAEPVPAELAEAASVVVAPAKHD
jgi:hypothetical protein